MFSCYFWPPPSSAPAETECKQQASACMNKNRPWHDDDCVFLFPKLLTENRRTTRSSIKAQSKQGWQEHIAFSRRTWAFSLSAGGLVNQRRTWFTSLFRFFSTNCQIYVCACKNLRINPKYDGSDFPLSDN